MNIQNNLLICYIRLKYINLLQNLIQQLFEFKMKTSTQIEQQFTHENIFHLTNYQTNAIQLRLPVGFSIKQKNQSTNISKIQNSSYYEEDYDFANNPSLDTSNIEGRGQRKKKKAQKFTFQQPPKSASKKQRYIPQRNPSAQKIQVTNNFQRYTCIQRQKVGKQQYCLFSTILRKLSQYPQSWPFRTGVNPLASNVSNYYNIIKYPMDLARIAHKLNNFQYNYSDEFHNDVCKIWENSYKFTSLNTQLFNLTRSCHQYYNSIIQQVNSEKKRLHRLVPSILPRQSYSTTIKGQSDTLYLSTRTRIQKQLKSLPNEQFRALRQRLPRIPPDRNMDYLTMNDYLLVDNFLLQYKNSKINKMQLQPQIQNRQNEPQRQTEEIYSQSSFEIESDS